MTMNEVTLSVDDEGIWRSDSGGSHFGIKWLEICGISGYTMSYDGNPEVELEFDFDYGESFRVNETWTGFEKVIDAINKRSMFRESQWFQKIKSVGENDEIYQIWQKS